MRERFGDWGAGLSDADFACALAAAGAANWDLLEDVELTPEILAFFIRNRLSGQLLPWLLPRRPPPVSPGILMQGWRAFRDSVGRERFGIAVEEDADTWILKQLSHPEVGAAFVERERPTRRRKDPNEGAYSVGGDDDMLGEMRRSPRVRSLGGDPAGRVGEELWKQPPPRKEPTPRWLQARLRRGSRDVKMLRGKGSYEAIIRIGQRETGWVSVKQPFPTPEEPSEPEGHRLTVIFWEPRLTPDEPQVQSLPLPPEGNTREISFPFEVPEGLERIAARVTVLHANRVLQTGLLRAAVGAPWTFTLDATPRTRLEGLSGRTEFDVALVLNHDDEGTARGTAIAGDQAVPINLSESAVEALTRSLGDQISKIAENPKRYESLRSEGTEEVLRTLAQHGGGLYRRLSEYNPLAKLDQVEAEGRQARLHLTSARPDSFFPVELVYRYEVPEETARICEHAPVALAEGSCPASCPSDKSEIVCPLGFWGLCHVIERHSYLVQPERPEDGFRLRPEPVLPRSLLDVSGKALLAASDAASAYETGAVETLLQKLRQRGPAELASSWKEWSERVKIDRPTLLVLLPHHKRTDGFEILEIGAADALKSVLVKKKHVRVEDRDRPIVLLMGCGTNLARIAFDSFVSSFILEGAAIVVSTIATILGRHASPATARLVELLDEEAGECGSTFGEVMVRLRRKLLATETPMALGLTAYGDADWILTRKADARDRDAPRPLR